MSRSLGNNLVVDLSLKSGEERLVDLMDLFNENPNDIVTVVGTVDEDGNPNTAPVSLIVARDENTLLVTLKRGQTTTKNLERNGRIIIEVVADEDVVLGIRGEAELVKEKMERNEAMSLWKVNIEEIKQDTSPAVIVSRGARSKPRSEAGEEFEEAMIGEMRELIED